MMGVRPLDEDLLVEAARSFDDMEAVARTLEGLVAADGATTAFLAVYSTYLRTHARAVADAVTVRRAEADAKDEALRVARAAAEAARAAVEAAEERQRDAESVPGRLRAHLDRLKESAAYRSHEQLADLERHVEDLATASVRADEASRDEGAVATRRQAESEQAGRAGRDATAHVERTATGLADDAAAAGIPWAPADAVAGGAVADGGRGGRYPVPPDAAPVAAGAARARLRRDLRVRESGGAAGSGGPTVPAADLHRGITVGRGPRPVAVGPTRDADPLAQRLRLVRGPDDRGGAGPVPDRPAVADGPGRLLVRRPRRCPAGGDAGGHAVGARAG